VTGLEEAPPEKPAGADTGDPEAMRANARLRGSLIPSRRKFAEGTGHVAFLGGSITEMDGYRPIVMEQLRKRYPKTKFTVTNAGVSSTCSTTGAFRLEEDVLAKGPVDLLLVEFAVNDDQDARHAKRECIRGMEGIIRHVRRHNPQADIVMVHFVNEAMLQKLAKGEEPLSSGAHEEVAKHYGISSVHVARELNRRIAAKTMDWKEYGGVHPARPGNQMAADLVELVLAQADQTLQGKQLVGDYPMPERLDSGSYERGRFLPNSAATLGEGWELSKPAWPQLKGECRPRFRNLDLLWTETPGAMMTVPFTGKTLGAYVLAGPDAGTLEVSIDAGPFKPVPLKHAYSGGLHYPRTVILAGDLQDAKHTARIRLAPSDKTTAARIVRLAVD
jgi:lysophospholipase L1-like esterase